MKMVWSSAQYVVKSMVNMVCELWIFVLFVLDCLIIIDN